MTHPIAWLSRVRPSKRSSQQWLISSIALLLIGCSSGYAPVTDLSINQNRRVEVVRGGQIQPAPNQYRVRRGDTLYSIAFRYGLDYNQLAAQNNIRGNYTIYVGQLLTLKPSRSTTSTTLATHPSNTSSRTATNKTSTTRSKASAQTTTKSPSSSNTSTKTPPKVAVASVPKTPTPNKASTSTAVQWRWPALGQLLRGDTSRGINLAGNTGDPVFAAASGKVVYAGDGLHGYGNLIIINHNQDYLSAYAHNSKILVKENDFVKVGGKIAEIGNSGAVSTMLHFEIRKDGKPVDPLKYLPKR